MIEQDCSLRLAQPVANLMTETFFTLPQESTLRDAARALRDRHIGLLLVTSGDELVGVISERDITTAVANDDSPDDIRLADRAAGVIITVNDTQSLQECVNLMAKAGIRHLVVVGEADRQPVGILSARDVLSELALV